MARNGVAAFLDRPFTPHSSEFLCFSHFFKVSNGRKSLPYERLRFDQEQCWANLRLGADRSSTRKHEPHFVTGCGCGGIGGSAGIRSPFRGECRFKSDYPHQPRTGTSRSRALAEWLTRTKSSHPRFDLKRFRYRPRATFGAERFRRQLRIGPSKAVIRLLSEQGADGSLVPARSNSTATQ